MFRVFGFQFETLSAARAYMDSCIAVARAPLTAREKTECCIAIATAMRGKVAR